MLLIEQNLGVAIDVADTVDVMVNGRIARSLPTAELAADRDLQQRLLGVRLDAEVIPDAPGEADADGGRTVQVFTVKRADDSVVVESPAPREERVIRGFTRWGDTGGDRVVDARAEMRPPEPAEGRAQVPRPGSCPWRRRSDARPTSPARSTPRGASCSSCAPAWRSWACAR